MAATESAVAAPLADGKPPAEKGEKLARVEKPDDDKYKRDLNQAEKQLSAVQDKIVLPPSSLLVRLSKLC